MNNNIMKSINNMVHDEKSQSRTKIIARYFNKKKSVESNNVKVSDYLPYPMQEALIKADQEKVISPDEYIIGPIHTSWDHVPDFQIGLTGTCKQDETPDMSVAREMGEEVGLKVEKDFHYFHSFTNIVTKGTFVIYETKLQNCIKLTNDEEDLNLSLKNDVRKNKVGCFIHGNEKEIRNYLDSEKINRYYSNDKIVGIAACRMQDAMKFVKSSKN
jgi:hypothetical protein